MRFLMPTKGIGFKDFPLKNEYSLPLLKGGNVAPEVCDVFVPLRGFGYETNGPRGERSRVYRVRRFRPLAGIWL